MPTQLELATEGKITDIMKKIASDEGLGDEYIRSISGI